MVKVNYSFTQMLCFLTVLFCHCTYVFHHTHPYPVYRATCSSLIFRLLRRIVTAKLLLCHISDDLEFIQVGRRRVETKCLLLCGTRLSNPHTTRQGTVGGLHTCFWVQKCCLSIAPGSHALSLIEIMWWSQLPQPVGLWRPQLGYVVRIKEVGKVRKWRMRKLESSWLYA